MGCLNGCRDSLALPARTGSVRRNERRHVEPGTGFGELEDLGGNLGAGLNRGKRTRTEEKKTKLRRPRKIAAGAGHAHQGHRGRPGRRSGGKRGAAGDRGGPRPSRPLPLGPQPSPEPSQGPCSPDRKGWLLWGRGIGRGSRAPRRALWKGGMRMQTEASAPQSWRPLRAPRGWSLVRKRGLCKQGQLLSHELNLC